MMRKGAVVRVISPEDIKDDDVVACGGGKGSPTVGIEKLPANEYVGRFRHATLSCRRNADFYFILFVRCAWRFRMVEAQKLVYDMLGYKPDSVIALEIGGGNGLQGAFSFPLDSFILSRPGN